VFAFLGCRAYAETVCPTLLWSDEFDETPLNTTNWEYQIGDGCAIGLCGWGDNERQYYKAENALVANGSLTIEAKQRKVHTPQPGSERNPSKIFGTGISRLRLSFLSVKRSGLLSG
jgi:beta-glucanase (GH16 family)